MVTIGFLYVTFLITGVTNYAACSRCKASLAIVTLTTFSLRNKVQIPNLVYAAFFYEFSRIISYQISHSFTPLLFHILI